MGRMAFRGHCLTPRFLPLSPACYPPRMATAPPRIPAYLAPWAAALSRLSRWSHATAADALSSLTLPALAAIRDWTRPGVDRMTDACAHGMHPGKRQRWTPRRVRYVRNHYRIRRGTAAVRRECHTPMERLRTAQERAEWGHLLPVWDEQQRAYVGGIVLRPREVLMLTLLRDNGDMGRRKLTALTRLAGYRSWKTHNQCSFRRLIWARLVSRTWTGGEWVYALTPAAALPGAEPGDTPAARRFA